MGRSDRFSPYLAERPDRGNKMKEIRNKESDQGEGQR